MARFCSGLAASGPVSETERVALDMKPSRSMSAGPVAQTPSVVSPSSSARSGAEVTSSIFAVRVAPGCRKTTSEVDEDQVERDLQLQPAHVRAALRRPHPIALGELLHGLLVGEADDVVVGRALFGRRSSETAGR